MTRHQIEQAYEKAGWSREDRAQDARHLMLARAADAYERYEQSLTRIEDAVTDLRRGVEGTRGIASVEPCALSTSAIEDLRRAAQEIETVRQLLGGLPLPTETPIADLIRAFVERQAIEREEG